MPQLNLTDATIADMLTVYINVLLKRQERLSDALNSVASQRAHDVQRLAAMRRRVKRLCAAANPVR